QAVRADGIRDVVGKCFITVPTRSKEARWRQLHLVSDNDRLASAIEGGYCIFQRNLTRLVEDHRIKEVIREGPEISNAQWAHHPDRFEISQHSAGFGRQQLTERFGWPRQPELVLKEPTPFAIGDIGRWGAAAHRLHSC